MENIDVVLVIINRLILERHYIRRYLSCKGVPCCSIKLLETISVFRYYQPSFYFQNDVVIGRMPIMLRSSCCVLYGKDEDELARLGWCACFETFSCLAPLPTFALSFLFPPSHFHHFLV